MKKISILLITILFAFAVKANVILDETFNYDDFATTSGWTTSGDLTTGSGRTIGGTALEYSNEGGTYVLSGEGKVLNHDYTSGTSYISTKEFSKIASGSVYLSYLYKANVAQNQLNGELLGFSNAATSPAVRTWAGRIETNGNPFRMGIVRQSSASADIQWPSSSPLSLGNVYLIIIKYDITAGKASLFINPVINSSTEPEPDAFDDSKGTARTSISYLMFRNSGSSKAIYDISGVRVSTSWEEAVAAKSTAPKLTAPVAQNASGITENSFTANWATVANAVGYSVKVYKNGVQDGVYQATGQSIASLNITELLSNTAYSYSVIAQGDETTYSNSDESNEIEFTTLAPTSYERINTNFGDGTWGTPFSTATGNYQTTVINGFQLQNAVLITGSLACSTGETHTNRIQLDKKANGGAIEFPLLKTVGEVEIHANAGTAGNPFALEIWENNSWKVIDTYSTLKTTDSIYIIPLEREVETRLRIANASGGGIVIYKIATRTYQESQELNITSTTPADGTTCYYNLTPNIVLTLNKEVELGTASILLNNQSIELNASMINGKTVTIPVTLESTTSGKSYTVTVPAGAFKEKDNAQNISNEKIFSFETVKIVAVPSGYESQLDVVYSAADAGRNRMDIYYPSTTTRSAPVPVVINIHGGGWNHGEKEAQGGFNIYFNMGFAVVNMEYRLTSDATAPAAIEDARCAMMYLLAHASELNIDPNKIIFQGGSAGAHIALTAAYLQGDNRFDTGCNNYTGSYKVIAVIDKYGPTDMWLLKDSYSSAANWLGSKQTDEDFVKSVSPYFQVNANTPPTYIIHGDEDPTIPYLHSVILDEKLTEAGVKHQFRTVPGGGHGGFPTEYNTQMNNDIIAFLTEVLDDNPLSLTPEVNEVSAFYTQVENKLLINIDGAVTTEIINLNGQVIQSTSAKEINLMDKGLFILKVTAKDKVHTQKILNQ